MKKTKITLVLAMFLFASFAHAGITIRYYNKDSKTHKFKVKTCGSTKTVEFGSSKTSSVTIQTGCDDAIIYTDCGEFKIDGDMKITIKDGCLSEGI